MKIIKCISEKVEEEIKDADAYIDLALEWKEKDAEASELFYELSREEMGHVDKLHEQVKAEIEEYRNTEGNPPEGMLELYNYLHQKHIAEAMAVKVKQGMYKEA